MKTVTWVLQPSIKSQLHREHRALYKAYSAVLRAREEFEKLAPTLTESLRGSIENNTLLASEWERYSENLKPTFDILGATEFIDIRFMLDNGIETSIQELLSCPPIQINVDVRDKAIE